MSHSPSSHIALPMWHSLLQLYFSHLIYISPYPAGTVKKDGNGRWKEGLTPGHGMTVPGTVQFITDQQQTVAWTGLQTWFASPFLPFPLPSPPPSLLPPQIIQTFLSISSLNWHIFNSIYLFYSWKKKRLINNNTGGSAQPPSLPALGRRRERRERGEAQHASHWNLPPHWDVSHFGHPSLLLVFLPRLPLQELLFPREEQTWVNRQN